MPRTLVVGDVHGCVQELVQLLEKADADRVILLGDLFTKGPEPVAVWRVIQEYGLTSVLGNHDQRLIDYIDGHRPSDERARRVVRLLKNEDAQSLDWLRQLPLCIELDDFWVVHAGIHPVDGVEGTTRKMALNMRSWPRDELGEPKWHVAYQGDKGVIFGHDARQGLFCRKKQGKPWLVGLDSGCVYGGLLSGFLVEELRVLQVKAKHCYRPV